MIGNSQRRALIGSVSFWNPITVLSVEFKAKQLKHGLHVRSPCDTGDQRAVVKKRGLRERPQRFLLFDVPCLGLYKTTLRTSKVVLDSRTLSLLFRETYF